MMLLFGKLECLHLRGLICGTKLHSANPAEFETICVDLDKHLLCDLCCELETCYKKQKQKKGWVF